MNQIRAIKALNDAELKNLTPPSASWHADHRHTAYLYFGSLPFELNEGDVCIIFSQYGEPVWVKLARDRDTGKSRGFGWLKYEDQRSTDLAVDNLNGADILGRPLKVDHAEYKTKGKDGEEDEGALDLTKEDADMEGSDSQSNNGRNGGEKSANETDVTEGRDRPNTKKTKRIKKSDNGKESNEGRPILKEERDLARLLRDHDDEDPMKEGLIRGKRKEVETAIRLWQRENRKSQNKDKTKSHRQDKRHHKHRNRSPREESDR
ncbi:MAG: hypothetical protein M1831_001342 [Alyxoria varia]|nr:MAG: hypothetical protein M1831_001342 [Alyxoria varia]